MTPTELRAVLKRCGLSQRAAARALDLDVRTIGRYCAAEGAIPRVVEYALRHLARQRQLRRIAAEATMQKE